MKLYNNGILNYIQRNRNKIIKDNSFDLNNFSVDFNNILYILYAYLIFVLIAIIILFIEIIIFKMGKKKSNKIINITSDIY